MLDVMSQAKNAIEAYNEALKVTSTNIANMNVAGYKKVDVSFQSIFEKMINQGTAAEGNMGGTNPKQFGQGMSIANTSINFSNGEYTQATPLDLAIQGNGLFILSPDGGDSFLYTRMGNFQVDNAYNLTSNGMQVYGFNSSGNVVPISALPSGNKQDYKWTADGALQYTADGGTTYTNTGYSIALTYFANPSGLAQAQGTTFAETTSSGPAATAQLPGSQVGSLQTGYVEQSNVFYLGETITALELQRAMSGNLSMLKLASDLINSFIQKLG